MLKNSKLYVLTSGSFCLLHHNLLLWFSEVFHWNVLIENTSKPETEEEDDINSSTKRSGRQFITIRRWRRGTASCSKQKVLSTPWNWGKYSTSNIGQTWDLNRWLGRILIYFNMMSNEPVKLKMKFWVYMIEYSQSSSPVDLFI